MCVSLKVCGNVCVFVSLCAFYLLTPRTSIPVRRTSRLSSQRDTERGQCEQRSFVQNECGHEKFGNGTVWETTEKLLLKSPAGWKPSTSNIGLWGRPFVRHLWQSVARHHGWSCVSVENTVTECALNDKCLQVQLYSHRHCVARWGVWQKLWLYKHYTLY